MLRKLLCAETAAAAAAVIIAIWLLMVKPLVGMANNGDFERIMGSAGLSYITQEYADKYFSYFTSDYQITGNVLTALGGYVSSQVLLVKLAGLLNVLMDPNYFDIRFLAALYTLLLGAAFYLIVRACRTEFAATSWIVAAVLVVVFADGGYLAYFNSLFGEPVSLLFLLLTFGLGLLLAARERASVGWLVLFYVAAIFVTGAKVQNAPIGIFLLLTGLRLWRMHSDRAWRRTVVAGSVLLALTAGIIYLSIDPSIKIINKYQTVFYGILKDSPTPEKDLKELGLPEEWAVLKNTNYFIPDLPIDIKDPAFEQVLNEKISHARVGLFYLKHPARFWSKLEAAADNAFAIKPSYLGNYEKTEGKPPGALSHFFTLWSSFKQSVLPHSLPGLIAFLLAYLIVWASWYRRTRDERGRFRLELLLLLPVIGLLNYMVPLIGDGEADLAKHLFQFNVCFDMMVVAAVVWAVYANGLRTKRIRALTGKG
ncbi:membrane protein [Paenibacillus sp. J31TS4]|uniref:glycan biosynthesis hexose transferase WsfD n=1 Tax=Paenibacillus sp. J31TS4 TaxID=2807195 RepID=UPI001B07CDE1|nr:hypothetical protein [Paenibacillus sp. J31TS4]GIP37562.1 membrane protein [Paenibacillus sp. J31TS4]